ncbi:MAG: NAD-dependent epimerase/dehydratase family protein [Acidimicrobiales bacterium]
MMGTRVLVTGGAGLVGSTIVGQLVGAGASEVLVLDNLLRGSRDNLRWALRYGAANLIEGDIRDRRLVDQVMAGIDIVFHQAGIQVEECIDRPRLALEVLAEGTFNLLEAARSAGVRKVIAASSAAVYGVSDEIPTPEDSPIHLSRTLYGAAKTFEEGMLRSFHQMYGLDYVALRYFNVYGPRMPVQSPYPEVLVRWMEQIGLGQPPQVPGPGTQTLDLVYVTDVARANLMAAESPVTDEVVNVGTGQETSLNDLARLLLATMDSDLEPQHVLEPAPDPIRRTGASTSKARRVLGFAAEVELDEGLRHLVTWWRREGRHRRAPHRAWT